jgi:AcrR family transcriptional regulator
MPTTRERLITATADLFRVHGYSATGVKQIVETAGAPFGSMYHFFPKGKEELGAETVRWSGALYGQLIDLFFQPGDDPVDSTIRFFNGAADNLRDTDYIDACPIATVALEVASTSEVLRQATADVFESWLSTLVDRFTGLGLADAAAHDVAVALFCLLEGAFILARATRDEEHVRAAGRTAASVVAAAVA